MANVMRGHHASISAALFLSACGRNETPDATPTAPPACAHSKRASMSSSINLTAAHCGKQSSGRDGCVEGTGVRVTGNGHGANTGRVMASHSREGRLQRAGCQQCRRPFQSTCHPHGGPAQAATWVTKEISLPTHKAMQRDVGNTQATLSQAVGVYSTISKAKLSCACPSDDLTSQPLAQPATNACGVLVSVRTRQQVLRLRVNTQAG